MPSNWGFGQSLPETVQALLFAVLGNVQHPPLGQIVHDRHVFVPLAEGLLVYSQTGNRLGLPPLEPALNGAFHDGVDLIPTQPQLLGHRLLAGGFEPGDCQSFKQRGEAAGWLCPRQFHHPHPMRGALAARRFGVQDGVVLAGVQVAPLALALMIVWLAGRSTLRTRPTGYLFGGQDGCAPREDPTASPRRPHTKGSRCLGSARKDRNLPYGLDGDAWPWGADSSGAAAAASAIPALESALGVAFLAEPYPPLKCFHSIAGDKTSHSGP